MFTNPFDFNGDGKVDSSEIFLAESMFRECAKEDDEEPVYFSRPSAGGKRVPWGFIIILVLILYLIGK